MRQAGGVRYQLLGSRDGGNAVAICLAALTAGEPAWAVPPKCRALIPEYVKDYVSLNQFAA